MAAEKQRDQLESAVLSPVQDSLLQGVSAACFADWYDERRAAENVLHGRAFFNTPPPVKEPDRHSPSQLLQCRRKMSYRPQNAPKEGESRDEIFWVRERVEEELVVPFLQDAQFK